MTFTCTIKATKGYGSTIKAGTGWDKSYQEYCFYTSMDSPGISVRVGCLSINQTGKEKYYCRLQQPKNILLELEEHRRVHRSLEEATESTLNILIDYHTQMIKALQELKKEVVNE